MVNTAPETRAGPTSSPPAISIVVTAPHGIEKCHFLSDLQTLPEASRLEIIVVDEKLGRDCQSHSGVHHISAPGRTVQGLIAEGVRRASHDWIMVTEDHCKPMPDLITRYHEALMAYPDADLIAGSVDNRTSTSPWSNAAYLTGLGAFWTQTKELPDTVTNANMLVRKSAILPEELAHDAALLNVTVPRLIAKGRFTNCRDAVVDHIVHLKGLEAVSFVTFCTLEWEEDKRTLPQRVRALPAQFGHSLAGFYWCAIRHPVEVLRELKSGANVTFGDVFRVFVVGIGVGYHRFKAELRYVAQQRWKRQV